jgi:hypothetical protein
MSSQHRTARCFLATLGWSAAGIVLGGLIGTLIWCGHFLAEGQSLGKAIMGEVEDALGALQGLLALGGLIGGGVGLLNGLRKVAE